jgi:radical SAM protein with 4Fe4S-binding SPASM domain
MLGTNGALLNKQIPILKNLREHLSINVTLDGIKEQHDMYRVFPDGSPSWEIVKNNMLTYQNLYNINGTKVTLGPDTIKYIYESSLFLWDEMNLKDINMNVVYENLWGDRLQECLVIFEEQLKLLYDDIIKNRRWEHEQYQGLLGSRHIPHHIIHEENQRNSPYCGAGVMRSVDSDGKIYPCFRFSPYALQENKTYALDNKEISRALKTINVMDSVSEKCRTCDLLSVCSVCIGGCVEEKETLFGRTMHHCEFQKLQSKYAFKLYEEINAIHSNN